MEENVEKDMTPILLKDLGVIFLKENNKEKRRCGIYQCQYCGKEFITKTTYVSNGDTKSCGCLKKKGSNTTHTLKYHPLYSTWNGMRQRCYNENNPKYNNYGGRGIQVCERWLEVKNFIEDMYPSYIEGLTLDRINNNGNYELENCRWESRETQQRNTRDIQSNNTSGYRGVSWNKKLSKWEVKIKVNNKQIHLGRYPTVLEAAKVYETYVRLNNLEHNFTPALTDEEIEELNKEKVKYEHNINS